MPTIEAIYIARLATEAVQRVDNVRAVASDGLEGDRYFFGKGTYSKPKGEADAGRNVTLIAAEDIEWIEQEFSVPLSNGQHRRNLITRGLKLLDLQRATLKIGTCVLRIDRTCPPCKHLSRLLDIDAEAILKNRGGLRATVIESGEIRVGDSIEILRQSTLV